jgi:polysaccharide deacetylase 2 family uncharacterized protein YibQ
MPKRKPRSSALAPRVLGLLAATALGLFLIGEAVRALRSDAGRLAVARTVGLGDRADLLRIVGKQLRLGLTSAGVPRDSITETPLEHGPAPVRWRVGLRPSASLLQVNYALTRTLEEHGAVVLEGGERWTDGGDLVVRLLVGLPRRPTHEVLIVRRRAGPNDAASDPARVALVLYGFGEDAAQADSFFALPAPFTVAVVPGTRTSQRVLLHARERERELVLHLPLEPLNYPNINPGPGTLLVSMKPRQISSTVSRYLDQAGPVAAVANHMGSLATQDMTVMTAVYRELRRRRVPFLHVSPAAGAVCKSLASDLGVNYAEADVVLDGEAKQTDPKALDQRWNALLKEARARGHLVVLLRATPTTQRWLPRALEARRLGGVSIVPLASLLDRPGTR